MNLTRTPYPDYGKPFHWWGYAWQAPRPVTLSALVSEEMLTADIAAFLVDALNEGKSLAVVSDLSGAGKSTLLWALVNSTRGDLRRIYVRGQYEPFVFSRPADMHAPPNLLMINEISPHLPVYCWGNARDRLFSREFAGFQKVATAHASTLETLCSGWRSWCESARPFDVTVFLSTDDPGRSRFRVSEIRAFD